MTDPLKVFRDMLDPGNWPQDYFVLEDEIWEYLPSGDPYEERIRKALFKGAMQ